jgi:hypothetical protein
MERADPCRVSLTYDDDNDNKDDNEDDKDNDDDDGNDSDDS